MKCVINMRTIKRSDFPKMMNVVSDTLFRLNKDKYVIEFNEMLSDMSMTKESFSRLSKRDKEDFIFNLIEHDIYTVLYTVFYIIRDDSDEFLDIVNLINMKFTEKFLKHFEKTA